MFYRGYVKIGDNVIFGPGVSIFSENHKYKTTNIPIVKQGVIRENVTIKNGAWLGANSIILAGVTIGENSVIAAGSVVNIDIPNNCVAAGTPAKILKKKVANE